MSASPIAVELVSQLRADKSSRSLATSATTWHPLAVLVPSLLKTRSSRLLYARGKYRRYRCESICEHWGKRTKVFGAISLIMYTTLVMLYPFARGRATCNQNLALSGQYRIGAASSAELESTPLLFVMYNASAFIMLAAIFLYIHLSSDEPTYLERSAGWCITLCWGVSFLFAAERVLLWCESTVPPLFCARFFQTLAVACYIRLTFVFMLTIQKRIQLTEVSFGASLRSWIIRRARQLSLAVGMICIPCFAVVGPLVASRSDWRYAALRFAYVAWALYHIVSALAFLIITFTVLGAFKQVRAAFDLPVGYVTGYVQAEAAWAHNMLGRLQWATVGPCALQSVLSALQALPWMRTGVFGTSVAWINIAKFVPLTQILGLIVDIACLFRFVGLFQARRPDIHLKSPEEDSLEVDTPKLSPKRLKSMFPSTTWTAKVHDLGNRSIDVACLLEFYGQLGPCGSMMPHFNPEKSTTNDVVRHAIIPASRVGRGGESYVAAKCSNETGCETLPERMVTHAWTNRFTHLVSAVIADALGIDEYEDISYALSNGQRADLESALLSEGTLHRRYWICAFCVNQHANICGSFGPRPTVGWSSPEFLEWDRKRRDVVTGEIYPTCACAQPKFFNDQPDECELNKFDDMMGYLCEQVSGFRQVVAVDEAFDLFSRAWCIAELVQAYFSGVPQDMRLLSRKVLDLDEGDLTIFHRLATLTVADCEASRPEDKAAILAKIPDVAFFDTQLQNVIFGDRGLFRQQLVGFGTWEAAVRVACRFQNMSSRTSFL